MSRPTGGKRLAKMIHDGKINKAYLWVDTYNQLVSEIAGTITCGVDFRGHTFITENYDEKS